MWHRDNFPFIKNQIQFSPSRWLCSPRDYHRLSFLAGIDRIDVWLWEKKQQHRSQQYHLEMYQVGDPSLSLRLSGSLDDCFSSWLWLVNHNRFKCKTNFCKFQIYFHYAWLIKTCLKIHIVHIHDQTTVQFSLFPDVYIVYPYT